MGAILYYHLPELSEFLFIAELLRSFPCDNFRSRVQLLAQYNSHSTFILLGAILF
jgi:hypothetical protein